MSQQLLKRSCPVCGASASAPFLQKGDLQLVRCGPCSMIYADPVPEQFVSGEYYDREGADFYLSKPKLESDYASVRFERELRIFRRHCAQGKVLDVGCSSGAFLFQLKDRWPGRYDILGTDVSGPPLDYAETRGVPVARGNFLELDLGKGEWDAITFWAVLEHLAQPALFLEQARRLLNPGGRCLVLVPNLGSLAARVLGARYRYVYPQHLNYFSKTTLTRLIEQQFRVVEIRSTHFNPLVIFQDWRGGGREVPNRDRARLLQRTTGYKQNPWLWPAKAAYRMAEGMLGTLFLADNLVVVLQSADGFKAA